MKEKFLKMTGVFFLVAMMAVMLMPVSVRAATLTGFSAPTGGDAASGTISTADAINVIVDNDNDGDGVFTVTNGTVGATTLINATVATTTLGSTHTNITGTATITGLLTGNGGAALNSLNTNNHVLVDDTSARLVGGGNSVAVTSAGGTTVTGALTSNGGDVNLNSGTAWSKGDASLHLSDQSMAQLVYTNSSDSNKVSGLQANDTNFNAGYQTNSSFSGMTTTINSAAFGYGNQSTGNQGEILVTDGATTATTIVNGGNGSAVSTLTLNAASATLATADGSGVTINNGGTVSVLNSADNGAHGLTIYTDHTVLSGGVGVGGSPTSSSLTLADAEAKLTVGNGTSPEIQVFRATNDGTNTSVYIDGSNADVTLVHNSASIGVNNGSKFIATNNQLTAKTADGSGLTVNNSVTTPGATVASLLNSAANGANGLTVKTDSTVMSGGTSTGSTSLTLNNWGATFNNNGPARVTGVADGKDDYDAVNYSQLQKAYIGIASISALAAIPSTMPGKKFAIGAGYGYFEHESALAIGMKASLLDSLSVTAGVGFGVGSGPNASPSANAGFSYSF